MSISNDYRLKQRTIQGSTRSQAKTKSNRQKAKRSQLAKRVKEREELAQFQHNQAIRRFPTRLSDDAEIDRLRILVAQCLAVMDRLLEFWELSVCPFQKEHSNLSKDELQTLVDARKESTTTSNKDHPYF